MTIGKGDTKRESQAHYDGTETRIDDKSGEKTTQPGLVLLRMVTNGGTLSIQH